MYPRTPRPAFITNACQEGRNCDTVTTNANIEVFAAAEEGNVMWQK
jgi:hypothetical protein